MANNREVSQLGSIIKVGDSAGRVGIANSVGINTTAPTGSFALDVHGTTNIVDEVKAICTAAWTTSVKDAWKAKLIADKSMTP